MTVVIDSADLPQPVAALLDALNSHDPGRVADCFTADYDSQLPQHPARSFVGSDRVRENWTAIFGRVPDLTAQVLRIAVNGPEIWTEWQLTGTAVDGGPAEFVGPVILTARDGQISWARFYLDPVDPPTT